MPDDPWVLPDAFWEVSFPFMFPAPMVAGAEEEVRRIVELAGVRAGDALDLCCGPGRHAVALARQGFRVTGVDRTAFLLDEARARAAQAGVLVTWVRADMREYAEPGAFDLAVNLFTSFGYYADDADNQRVLDNVHASLRPGGVFVVDVMGKEVLAKIYEPTGSSHLEGVGTSFQRRRFVEGFSQMDLEWTFLSDAGEVRRFHLRHWVYSGRELETMLRRAGFAEVTLYGHLDGRPYAPGAARLVAVARRLEETPPGRSR